MISGNNRLVEHEIKRQIAERVSSHSRPSAKLQSEFQSGLIGDNQVLSGNWESNFPFEELAKRENR